MEEQKSIAQLVILGSIILIFMVILFVGFLISQKRKRSALKDIIDLMKINHDENYNDLKREIEQLKKDKADKNDLPPNSN